MNVVLSSVPHNNSKGDWHIVLLLLLTALTSYPRDGRYRCNGYLSLLIFLLSLCVEGRGFAFIGFLGGGGGGLRGVTPKNHSGKI
jgi:hypothetical protein